MVKFGVQRCIFVVPTESKTWLFVNCQISVLYFFSPLVYCWGFPVFFFFLHFYFYSMLLKYPRNNPSEMKGEKKKNPALKKNITKILPFHIFAMFF